jgi:carbon starvation protein CstA
MSKLIRMHMIASSICCIAVLGSSFYNDLLSIVFTTSNPLPHWHKSLVFFWVACGSWTGFSASFYFSGRTVKQINKEISKDVGFAAPILESLIPQIDAFNQKVAEVSRVASTLVSLQSADVRKDTPEFTKAIERKIAELKADRAILVKRLDLANKLWGINEGVFDGLADILSIGDKNTIDIADEAVADNVRKLSASIEVEAMVAGVEPIDRTRKRLGEK